MPVSMFKQGVYRTNVNQTIKNKRSYLRCFLGSICALSCVLSMIFAHGAGNYAFTLFDNFAGSFPLLIIALGETISIAWIYGLKRYEPMQNGGAITGAARI